MQKGLRIKALQAVADEVMEPEDAESDYHRGKGGQQMLCYTCHGRPCADRCTEQWMPDTLHMGAARANTTIEAWAAAHSDWIGWTLHRQREDAAAYLALGDGRSAFGDVTPTLSDLVATAAEQAPIAERPSPDGRIPVGAALGQALEVLAG